MIRGIFKLKENCNIRFINSSKNKSRATLTIINNGVESNNFEKKEIKCIKNVNKLIKDRNDIAHTLISYLIKTTPWQNKPNNHKQSMFLKPMTDTVI